MSSEGTMMGMWVCTGQGTEMETTERHLYTLTHSLEEQAKKLGRNKREDE